MQEVNLVQLPQLAEGHRRGARRSATAAALPQGPYQGLDRRPRRGRAGRARTRGQARPRPPPRPRLHVGALRRIPRRLAGTSFLVRPWRMIAACASTPSPPPRRSRRARKSGTLRWVGSFRRMPVKKNVLVPAAAATSRPAVGPPRPGNDLPTAGRPAQSREKSGRERREERRGRERLVADVAS
ncbi:hypothetical protein DAI22_06g000301 [Oryza sativa Japonica Group]|nr:hypothetical protein DAI22_06g000301 [Oryza sativa Japonica Group]